MAYARNEEQNRVKCVSEVLLLTLLHLHLNTICGRIIVIWQAGHSVKEITNTVHHNMILDKMLSGGT